MENKSLYDKIYKLILIIPFLLLLFSVIYLYNFQKNNGDIIYKDVTLTGGTTITVLDTNIDIADVKSKLSQNFPDISVRRISDFRTDRQIGFIIETKVSVKEIQPALEEFLGYKLTEENSSIEFSGETLSQGFYQQLRFAIFLAFIMMAIVIFIIFRTFVPSFAVILCAFADIVMTIVVVDIMGISLSNAGVIAFLMLIGYSVDTDILLTTRIIKRKEGTINGRVYSAFKTGMTMTLTSIAAIGVSLLLISNSSEVLRQIFTILLIGLFFDIFNTWITNASLIKWHVERKEAPK